MKHSKALAVAVVLAALAGLAAGAGSVLISTQALAGCSTKCSGT